MNESQERREELLRMSRQKWRKGRTVPIGSKSSATSDEMIR